MDGPRSFCESRAGLESGLALRVAVLEERTAVGYISPEELDVLYSASVLLLCREAVVTSDGRWHVLSVMCPALLSL